MTRIISDSKFFSFSNISAAFAIAGLVGLAGTAFVLSNYNNAYALGEQNAYAHIVHKEKHIFKKSKNNHKTKVDVKMPDQAFLSFGHKDQSSYILVNFDEKIELNTSQNTQFLPNNIGLQSNTSVKPSAKIIQLTKKVQEGAFKSISSRKMSKLSQRVTRVVRGSKPGLTLVAGGVKELGEKSSYSSSITGLQKVIFPKNGLQFVAGISRNKLNSYMMKNCDNTSVCNISNLNTKKIIAVEKIEISAIPTVRNVDVKQFKKPTQKVQSTVVKHAIKPSVNNEPLVIMLDESF